MRLLSFILLAFLCVFVALFAASNMDLVTLRLSLLFPNGVTLYASVWILLAVAIGMVAGMLFGWFVGGDQRARHRQAQSENRRLAKQVNALTKLTAAGGVGAGDAQAARSTQAAPKPIQKQITSQAD